MTFLRLIGISLMYSHCIPLFLWSMMTSDLYFWNTVRFLSAPQRNDQHVDVETHRLRRPTKQTFSCLWLAQIQRNVQRKVNIHHHLSTWTFYLCHLCHGDGAVPWWVTAPATLCEFVSLPFQSKQLQRYARSFLSLVFLSQMLDLSVYSQVLFCVCVWASRVRSFSHTQLTIL